MKNFKKIIALALCAVMMLACTVPAFAEDVVVADCCEGLTPGDANEDGEADFKDVTVMIRYGAGYDLAINQDNADVQNNGEVDMKDIALLVRVLAGWTDVRLGHLDEYQFCTLCGSKSENFDAQAVFLDWTKDTGMRSGVEYPMYTIVLRKEHEVNSYHTFVSFSSYEKEDGDYGAFYIYDYYMDDEKDIQVSVTLFPEDVSCREPKPEDTHCAIVYRVAETVYDDAGGIAGINYIKIVSVIMDDGSFVLHEGGKFNKSEEDLGEVPLTAEEMAPYEDVIKAEIAEIAGILDAKLAESAPFTSADLGLVIE